jgi:hypothetical protein
MGKFASPSQFLSQPAIYVEAMETIGAAVTECTEYLSEQARRESGVK